MGPVNLHALNHHVERLAEDHRNARRLADGLAALRSVTLNPESVQTNIVIFSVPDAPWLPTTVAELVTIQAIDAHQIRAVTHMGVSAEDVEHALGAIAAGVANWPSAVGSPARVTRPNLSRRARSSPRWL